MSRHVTLGRWCASLYCGERLWRVLGARGWLRRYGLFRRVRSQSFSLGPVLFWRSDATGGR